MATQGSGKTALAYYLNSVLTDYYSKNNKVAKFYFIVDRIDLLKQAKDEFEKRGLQVKTANSRSELMAQFKTQQSQEGLSGKKEIVVVNIQRFESDNEKVELPKYSTNLQRVFIIDEAHRGYRPEGSFLQNLFNADPNAVKIAFTGTPLLKEERESWRVFGNYFHTYYYDKSIQDGYTLKIIREPILTTYKERISEIYDKLDILVQKKEITKADIIENETYIKELLKFIISDFKKFRFIHSDNDAGAMVICETSKQARIMHKLFCEIQDELNSVDINKSYFKSGLVLYDSDDKETQSQLINNDFKKNNKIDILFVFNMLLTGFDAPQLKRLYFGRKMKDHSLLQAITRVNRPFKDYRFGYMIDFADIKKSFDETNEAYLKELNRFNDIDEVGECATDTFIQIFEDTEVIQKKMDEIKQTLFNYDTDNLENFSTQISQIEDKSLLLKLKNALSTARDYFNIIKTFGDDELKQKFKQFEIKNLPSLIREIQGHIDIINQKEAINTNDAAKLAINEAMYGITFKFDRLTPEELKIGS